MESFRVGEINVYQVEEWQGPFAPPEQLFVGYQPGPWRDREASFVPDFCRGGACYAFLQSWVLDYNGLVILFDPGIGNDKDRPNTPLFSKIQTPYLDNLAAAGFKPEDVDIVINSHLHIDHIGWNTRLVGDTWTPTFPNARYICSTVDFEFWDPAYWHSSAPKGAQVHVNGYSDSIRPILSAGLYTTIRDGYQVAPGLTLTMAPGHTPGQLIMHAESKGDRAMFVGDVLHHPMQVYEPGWSSVFCEDPERAVATRRDVLTLAAERQARLVPGHFGGKHWVWVERAGKGFRPVFE
jgi:glyoxylase-like metal-dependent hydrolase (beta-lactamase superfamily II)